MPARQTLRLGRHRHNWEPIHDMPCEVPVGRWIALAVKTRRAGDRDPGGRQERAPPRGRRRRAAARARSACDRGSARRSYRNLWVKTGEQRPTRALSRPSDRRESQRHVAAGAARHAPRAGSRWIPSGPFVGRAVAARQLSRPARANAASRTRDSIAGA